MGKKIILNIVVVLLSLILISSGIGFYYIYKVKC